MRVVLCEHIYVVGHSEVHWDFHLGLVKDNARNVTAA